MSRKNENKNKCTYCGANNGNYAGGRCHKHRLNEIDLSLLKEKKLNENYISVICVQCGQEFLVLKWNKVNSNKGKYCSQKCKKIHRSKNIIFVNCKWCNKFFKTYKYKVEKGRSKYCSRICFSLAKTVQYIGENNPHWKGIKLHLNRIRKSKEGRAWTADIKKLGKCQICGSTENLQSHHITTLFNLFILKTGGKTDCAYDPNDLFFHKRENGMLVCEVCHENIHPFISVLKKRKT